MKSFRPRRTALVAALALATAGGLAVASPSTAAAEEVSPEACMALTGQTVPVADGEPVRIVAAVVRPASDSAPAHCALTGRIGDRITADLRVPLEGWDGRYVQVGGGGFCGTVPTASGGADPYLSAGSAVGSDDTGHVGSPFNAEWAAGNPQSQVDWAYLSEHLMVAAARTLLTELAGEPPHHSYFLGCSTGGRQGLMSAQRYPDDFDGIVAGAPANRQNHLAVLSQGYRERVNHRPDGSLILEQSDAETLAAAVAQTCDGADGVEDGVVADPRDCRFDPATLRCPDAGEQCLTDEQLSVVRAWYDDPRDSAGTSMYPGGIPAGSESGLPLTNILGPSPAYSFGGQFAEQVLKYLAFPEDPPPDYGLEDFDFDADRPLLDQQARALYNADDPDMSAFRDSGGKLLLWHGFADPLITPFATIEYYEHGLAGMGGLDAVQQWYRFFLLPGVHHCSGGPGPDSVDWYAAIVAWVENGSAPDRLVASGADVTRPLFPYPQRAVYTGSGDPAVETSFVAAEGPRGRATSIVLGPEPVAETRGGQPEPGRGAGTGAEAAAAAGAATADAAPGGRRLAATGTALDVQATLAVLALLTAAVLRRRRRASA